MLVVLSLGRRLLLFFPGRRPGRAGGAWPGCDVGEPNGGWGERHAIFDFA